LTQTPQMYDNWPGEAVLMTTGNTTAEAEYWAVIAGVSDYAPGSGLQDLQYTDDDAYDMRDALLEGSNWHSSHITMLIDEGASKGDIQQAIEDMGNAGEPDDVFLFYFSGHGGTVKDMLPFDETDELDEILCPYDFNPDDPESAINDDELGNWLAALPGEPVLVALDTCHSGGMIRQGVVQSKGIGEGSAAGQGDGFARDLYGVIDGVVVTACDDAEASYEDPILQNGVFTYYLVEGLNGAADANGDDQISMEEAFNYAYWRVTGYAPPFSFVITIKLDAVGVTQ
ncbi:MAG: caspase family protein, partial [Chloroflexota bacterium]|nr:caspase family protein [Chloroflexota bacterium]